MNATKTNLTVVWTASWQWLEIAQQGGMSFDGDDEPISSEWAEACELCDFNPEDSEVCFTTIHEVRECDTLLKPGDLLATQGYGEDVVFLRREVKGE